MSAPPTLDPDTLDAIALAETQREMLRHLADWGMALSRDICQRSMDSPYHPELKHDPGRAFAAASRAVRLTLAMQARVQKEIIALRNGPAPAAAPSSAERPDRSRDEARATDRESLERETGDVDEARESHERDHERLTEGEDFEDIVAGDFDVCVGVIRAGLGLGSRRPRSGENRPAGGEQGGEGRVQPDVGGDPHSPTPDLAAPWPVLRPPKWGGSVEAVGPEPGGGSGIIRGAGDVPDNPNPDFAENGGLRAAE